MKILFVSNTNPFNKSFGAEQRSYMIRSALINAGLDVDVAYVGIVPYEQPHNEKIVYWNNISDLKIDILNRILRLFTLRMFPRSKAISKDFADIISKRGYDAIICRYIHTAYLCGLERYNSKLIIDFDDWPVSFLKSCLPSPKDLIHRTYYNMMINGVKRQVAKSINNSAKVFLANPEDALSYECGVLPNISLNRVETVNHITGSKTILFIGKLDYLPNIQGIDYFLNNIWPRVLNRCPDAEFRIAGSGDCQLRKNDWEKHSNVKVLGFFENIYDFYSLGNIVVCPIYSGSGTNIKSIESLCMGKASVFSEFSAKGISESLINHKNAIIASSDEEMAEGICQLMSDELFCIQIQQNGLKLATNIFSESAIAEILLNVINNIQHKCE